MLSGNKCPSCGEYDLVHMEHDPDTGRVPTVDEDVAGHWYCRNCDYGVCEFC